MKTIHKLLIAAAFAPVTASAQVTQTFDTDLGFFTAGTDAGPDNPVWSGFNGGSMQLTIASGWKPQTAKLDLMSNPALFSEFQSALVNGGTLSYDLFVRTADITGSDPQPFPQWFEPMYVGNSDGVWDQTFGSPRQPVYYGAGAFPAGAVQKTTITYPIEAASAAVSDARAQFKAGSGWNEIFIGLNSGGNNFTSGKIFIDNFRIQSNAVPVVVPPPVTTLQPAKPGLNLVASGGSQWSRQNVRTTNPQYSWVGAPGPVSYSFTITDYPAAAGFTSVLFLVPGAAVPNTISDLDWNRPICFYARMVNNGDGTASMAASYKNGTEGNNGIAGHDYFTADNPADLHDGITTPTALPGTGKGGQLAFVNSSAVLGKWTLTFTSNTSLTLTTPGGQTATGSLPNDATAQLFANPLYAYFGIVPGDNARIGMASVLSRIEITGTNPPVSSDIDTLFTEGTLEKAAADGNGVVQVPAGPASWWFSWTLPATDYAIQQSTSLGTGVGNGDGWVNVAAPAPYTINGAVRTALLPAVGLVSDQRNYFRMAKP